MRHPLEKVERWSQRAGLAALGATLALLLWGIWRGTRRPGGRGTGRESHALRSPAFYALASTGYLGCCYWLWRPLPFTPTGSLRRATLVLGSSLYFPGLALVAWGRLALGQMYGVSSTFGARLYAGHRLVTHGPYACIRHPMYGGILLVSVGGLLLYRTWSFAFLLLQFPVLVVRARREEQALAAEFGGQWAAYAQRVPAWIPCHRPARAEA